MLPFPVRLLLSAALLAAATACGAAQRLSVPAVHPEEVPEEAPCDDAPPAHVRLLYIVDVSQSLTVTDPEDERLPALQEHLHSQTGDDLQVGFVTFGETVVTVPFAPADTIDLAAVNLQTNVDQLQTDLEGALLAAHRLVRQEAQAAPPHTRFRVVLMTDGASAPLCCLVNEEQTSGLADYPSQCDPPQWRINRDLDVDLDVVPRFCEGEPEQLLCNEQTALDRYRDYIVENGPAGEAFIGFVAGGDRNRSYRNGALLREIEGFVHAADGTLRLDAVLLQNPSLSVEIQSRFGIDTCALEVRLTALTDAVNDGHTVSSPTDGSLHFPLDTTQCPDIAAVP